MKKVFQSAFVLLALTTAAIAQEKAKGIIYEDLNNNGKKEKKGKTTF